MATFEELQNSVSGVYGLRDKLFLYVHKRSVAAFDRADRRRNRIKNAEAFLKYQ